MAVHRCDGKRRKPKDAAAARVPVLVMQGRVITTSNELGHGLVGRQAQAGGTPAILSS